jgi:hypothetical protein
VQWTAPDYSSGAAPKVLKLLIHEDFRRAIEELGPLDRRVTNHVVGNVEAIGAA